MSAMPERSARNVPRETNPVILVLARVAAAVDERERRADQQRRTMTVVDGRHRDGGATA